MENSDLVTLAVIKLGDPVYNGGKGQKRRGRMCFLQSNTGAERIQKIMEFHFLGGAMEIGGSCIYVRIAGKGILMDCGIRQSGTKDPIKNCGKGRRDVHGWI